MLFQRPLRKNIGNVEDSVQAFFIALFGFLGIPILSKGLFLENPILSKGHRDPIFFQRHFWGFSQGRPKREIEVCEEGLGALSFFSCCFKGDI